MCISSFSHLTNCIKKLTYILCTHCFYPSFKWKSMCNKIFKSKHLKCYSDTKDIPTTFFINLLHLCKFFISFKSSTFQKFKIFSTIWNHTYHNQTQKQELIYSSHLPYVQVVVFQSCLFFIIFVNILCNNLLTSMKCRKKMPLSILLNL